jgi:hypothetical protein
VRKPVAAARLAHGDPDRGTVLAPLPLRRDDASAAGPHVVAAFGTRRLASVRHHTKRTAVQAQPDLLGTLAEEPA